MIGKLKKLVWLSPMMKLRYYTSCKSGEKLGYFCNLIVKLCL